MLVGTATTGAGVSPPITLANVYHLQQHHHHGIGHGDGVDLGQEPVQSGDAAVHEERGLEAQGGEDGDAFGGHRYVRGAGRDHGHRAGPVRCGTERHRGERPALRDDARAVAERRPDRGDRLDLRTGCPGQEDRSIGAPQELLDHRGAVFRRFARAVHGLGHALTEVPVEVDPGEAKVGVGQPAQLAYGVVR